MGKERVRHTETGHRVRLGVTVTGPERGRSTVSRGSVNSVGVGRLVCVTRPTEPTDESTGGKESSGDRCRREGKNCHEGRTDHGSHP